MKNKEKLRDFAIWIFNQRAVDIKFYGASCIDKLIEVYLDEQIKK